jgi:hypothetical protein
MQEVLVYTKDSENIIFHGFLKTAQEVKPHNNNNNNNNNNKRHFKSDPFTTVTLLPNDSKEIKC